MKRITNTAKISKITYGSDDYIDLSDFTEVIAETGSKGVLGIIDTGGGKRVRFSKILLSALEEPEAVKLLVKGTQAAFKSVKAGTSGAYEFGKDGVIYATDLAEKIMKAASNVEFRENATTRCGQIEKVQSDQEGNTIVILNLD